MHFAFRGFSILVVYGLGLSTPLVAAPESTESLVAIGDVHGDLDTFLQLLRKTGLIDAKGAWRGGTRHLVQTGDLVDRGAKSREVLELVMRLQREASEAGGHVAVLLGNHEVMNIVGDLRYVLAAEFAAYAGSEDDRLRQGERDKILALLDEGSPLLSSSYYRRLAGTLSARDFDREFPPGYFAHRAAFSSEGRFGKWLLGLPFAHVEDRVVFVHGGLTERYGLLPLDALNQQCKKEMALLLGAMEELEQLGVYRRSLGTGRLRELMFAESVGGPHPKLRRPFATIRSVWGGILYSEDGPIWSRSLALGSEAPQVSTVLRVLKAHGADRIVIGHSQPKSKMIEARFEGRVILIDTGMNQSYYRGTPSALLLRTAGEFEVITASGGG